jgi:hypothetical protein
MAEPSPEHGYYLGKDGEKIYWQDADPGRIDALEDALRREREFRERYRAGKAPQHDDGLRLRRLELWLRYFSLYLDDAELIGDYDWKAARLHRIPAKVQPANAAARRDLAHENFCHFETCVTEAINEAREMTDIPAVREARVCLAALSESLTPTMQEKDGEPIDERSTDELVRDLVRSRDLLRTPLALAASCVNLIALEMLTGLRPPKPGALQNDGVPGFLGLTVDSKNRTVQRRGYTMVTVDLGNSPALWDTFRVFLAAEATDAPGDALPDFASLRKHRQRLRELLLPLDITIPSKGRRLIHVKKFQT